MQQKENLSTLNQVMARIQELQDKVKSLNDAKEFCDPENCEQLWIVPRSQSTIENSESQKNDQLRFSLAWTPQDTFLKVFLLEVNHLQHSWRKFT